MRSTSGIGQRLVALGLLISLTGAPARGDQVLLDERDCVDWARTFDSIVWKQKGSALGARSLLRFDLSDLGAVQAVTKATLELFIERGQPGASLHVYHVHDDGWSYRLTPSASIYQWPKNELIATVAAADSASVALDVTAQVVEDLAGSADRKLSIKLESTPDFAGIRVASPLAPRWTMAPRLHVSFQPAGAPLPPDLTLSRGDITFDPMQPMPNAPVTVSARVRNNSASTSAASTVEFWNGPPGAVGTTLIGSAPLPALSSGGGAALVQTAWSAAPQGLHDVHVIVDPNGLVPESDESNNAAFRPYLVADAYGRLFESFEYAGQPGYYTDFEFPPQFGLEVPKPAFLVRSGSVSCHGDAHMEAIVDGTADDGTVWIERAFPVEPRSRYRVRCDWRDYRYEPDLAFWAVAAIGVLDPEMEADFTFLGIPPAGGCTPWSLERIVDTGPYDHVWVACGFSITWETPGILGLDSLAVELTKLTSGAVEPPAESRLLSGPIPNPASSGAEITFSLSRRARIEVAVVDAQGRNVRRVLDGHDGPGTLHVRWDGRTSSGAPAAPGLYWITLNVDGEPLGERKLAVVR